MWMLNSIRNVCLIWSALLLLAGSVSAQDLRLEGLVDEALKNNPDILASRSRIEAARHRIPQSRSLPDPLITFGYQNEGFNRYTYGEEQNSQWMFGATQQFFFPGKRALKADMAERDAESLEAMHELLKLKTASRIKELYYDLFLAYKNIDLLQSRQTLFARIEDIALARYGTGKAMQQEVLMAQTEKYMILEKEVMFRQKIQSLEAMINSVIGRDRGGPLGKPAAPLFVPFGINVDRAVAIAMTHSPEIKSREKMIEGANSKVLMAQKEYYPDFSINAGYFNRKGDFKDMWSLTSTVSIPLYYKSRQEPAVMEAKASLAQAKQELAAVKLMIEAAIRDNISMINSAGKLMALYKDGLIPKNTQDVESALTGYANGRTEAIVVLSRVKTLLDYETQYWTQFAERGKATARVHAIMKSPDEMGDGEKK
ncbi:MAG: Outer membrane efflux protein CusC [Syntrophus sp. SKADARSKE-3]|nr:Outer membrane efflux protein CusC [Syntrophus sp. SKADARSKE-3]